jgi:hypothetical protein
MRITHVSYERNGPVPGADKFTRHRVGLTVEVREDESPDEALERAKRWVDAKLAGVSPPVRREPRTDARPLDLEDFNPF